jgi:nitronate monooxygenase
MPLKTKLTEALGIEIPVICGGMHYVGYAELAAAVSEAGGLGIITALTQPTPEDLRKEIQKCKKLTKKPIGVNITLLPALKPPNYGAYIEVIIQEGIKIVETAGRNPDQVIPLFKRHDIVVIHKCVSVRHALTAQRLGADFISIDGLECAGHPGEFDVGNWVLLAQCKQQLKVPYIVSGGCANGSQLAAALALGAEGMNMGSRFMATKEAPLHENIKKALVDANEQSTMLLLRSLKNTERVFKNSTAKKVAAIESEKPGDLNAILPYIKGENYRKSFQETGDTDSSIWSCGQSVALIHDIPTCKVLLDGIVKECEEAILFSMQCIISGDAKRSDVQGEARL